jgi:hypothetical protein
MTMTMTMVRCFVLQLFAILSVGNVRKGARWEIQKYAKRENFRFSLYGFKFFFFFGGEGGNHFEFCFL